MMMARMFLLTIFLFAFAVVTATTATTTTTSAASADEIISLPGWIGSFPSKQYSGYLDGGNGKHLHYWFVESEGNPSKDPVVVWFNGGPGCSSLDGFFYEHGPWMLSDDGTTLSIRPYRWNRLANVLYIESPVGVGFSYSDTNSYFHDDDSSAQDNKNAIESFYQKFPQYFLNKFYITGESYAGIYVPMLAYTILQAQAKGQYTGAAITGIAVGNGCTGKDIGICAFYFNNICEGFYYEVKYLMTLAFMEPDLKAAIDVTCDWDTCLIPGTKYQSLSAECLALIDYGMSHIGAEVDTYNVFGRCSNHDACPAISTEESSSLATTLFFEQQPASRVGKRTKGPYSPLPLSSFPKYAHLIKDKTQQQQQQQQQQHLEFVVNPNDDNNNNNGIDIESYGPTECFDSFAATTYLMNPLVQAAIHVKAIPFCWAICNRADGFKYKSSQPNLPRDIYPFLLQSSLKVLIYNGDFDACVPYVDNQAWTGAMHFNVTKPWHPWLFIDEFNTTQIGGYSTKYNVQHLGTGSFEFRTVRGAGHMVPSDVPEQGLALLGHLIKEDFDTTDTYLTTTTATATGCQNSDAVVAAYYHERSVITTTAVIVCLFLLLIIAFLTNKLNQLQQQQGGNSNSNSNGDIEFSPMIAGVVGSGNNNNKGSTAGYTSVRKQDEDGDDVF